MINYTARIMAQHAPQTREQSVKFFNALGEFPHIQQKHGGDSEKCKRCQSVRSDRSSGHAVAML